MKKDAQARRAEIKRRYAWHDEQRRKNRPNKAHGMALIRLREMERLFFQRYGHFLPDDEAGRDDLRLAANHIAHLPGDVVKKITGWARMWCPWMSDVEAKRLAERVTANPRKFVADDLGCQLGLTASERADLRITTIGAVDQNKAEREIARKERRREAARKSRAREAIAAGRTPGVNGRPSKKPVASRLNTIGGDGFLVSRRERVREVESDLASEGMSESSPDVGKSSVHPYFNSMETIIEGVDIMITGELDRPQIEDGAIITLPNAPRGGDPIRVRHEGKTIDHLEAVDDAGTVSWCPYDWMNFHITLQPIDAGRSRICFEPQHVVILDRMRQAAH